MELAYRTTTQQHDSTGRVPSQRAHLRTIRILIADDEADIRHLVSLTLTLDGDDLELVPVAADGAAALAGWREHRPDVLVLDHRMPELTGLDVAGAVLAEDPSAAIVLFSASLDAVTIRWAETLGVTCLGKTELDRLAGVVRELCARRRLATES